MIHAYDEEGEGFPIWLGIKPVRSSACLIEFGSSSQDSESSLLSLECPIDVLMDPIKGHKIQLSGAMGSCQLAVGTNTIYAELRIREGAQLTRFNFAVNEYKAALHRVRVASASSLL